MRRRNHYALGRKRDGSMNKTESAYALSLQSNPDVTWFKFEGLKLRLADKTFYTPDFFVMRTSGELEVHEVKGFWEDDARVKIKVAAELYPFRFFAIKAKRGEWEIEEI